MVGWEDLEILAGKDGWWSQWSIPHSLCSDLDHDHEIYICIGSNKAVKSVILQQTQKPGKEDEQYDLKKQRWQPWWLLPLEENTRPDQTKSCLGFTNHHATWYEWMNWWLQLIKEEREREWEREKTSKGLHCWKESKPPWPWPPAKLLLSCMMICKALEIRLYDKGCLLDWSLSNSSLPT